MLTTTALVLATLVQTVQPISPTAKPTYTIQEKAAYAKGWQDSIRNYSCLMLCDERKNNKSEIARLKKLKLTYKDSSISIWAISVVDKQIQAYIEENQAIKQEIKERGDCDCAKFEDKK